VIFKKHLKSTADFIGANCDLVIWPETMLPSGMNRQFLELDPAMLTDKGKDAQRQLQDQAANLADMSRRLQCPILAGGTTLHPNSDPTDRGNPLIVRNSTLWFDQADRPSRQYSKMRMVPFSEYVPFKQSWPALHRALRWFVPPVMEQLEPGAEPVRFDLFRGRNNWAIATPICFEGTFPDICRKLVVAGGRKEADILANLSNDGWFVFNWGGGPYVGSTEHPMHLAHYCFRAVENRVPVVRAVNTGVSALIDSSGRIAATVGRGRVKAMAEGTLLLDGRIGEDGRLLPGHGPKVLVDGRVSLYSLAGDVFAWAVGLAFVVLAGWLTWKRIAQEKGKP
jgi:apolipoprotein N-acyltransferase